MKKIREFLKKHYLVIIPFLVTFFLYGIIVSLNKDLYPFGKDTILYSDMGEQYISFFNYLRNTILSNNGIFNSFSFSLGNNFYGILTYFCISPLNIFLLFSTNVTMPIFVTIIMVLKMSLASSTMAILLKNKYDKSLFIVIFSVLYGLMSYNLVYSINIIWMDCVYLLPLIVLGFERLIEKNDSRMYLITLTLSIFCNYYISFSICVFLVIYYIYYILVNRFNKDEIMKSLLRFVKYSILAALLSSIILLPTIFNMLDGKMITTSADFSLTPSYNVTVLGYKFMIGDNKFIIDDLPFISTSLIVLLLVSIYVFNKKIGRREKIVTIGTLIFLVVISCLHLTDTILHCFRNPNMFPHRYAFIIAFFTIIMAYKNFSLRDYISKKNIFLYVLVGGLVFYYLKLYIGFRTVTSAMFLVIYFGSIMFVKDKKLLLLMIIPFSLIELTININTSINELPRNSYDYYYDTYRYEKQINEIKPLQNEFYRIEGRTYNTINDNFALNYYGIRSFSPTITVNTNKILKDYLGLPLANSYAVDYVSNTGFTDSFLGIKYLYYIADNSYYLGENQSVFPVLFSINNDSKFVSATTSINNQNELYRYLSMNNQELFIEISDIKIEYCSLEEDEQGIYIKSENGNFCKFEIDKKDDNYEYYLEIISNDLKIIPGFDSPGVNSQYGKNVIMNLNGKIILYVSDKITYIDSFKVYKMDKNKLYDLSKLLNNQKLNIRSHTNDRITGTINNQKSDQIMFTTIPYDEGWHVKINNEDVVTFKNIGSLLAFSLPEGELDIEIYFIPKGFVLGLTISLFSLDAILYMFLRKNKHEKIV